MSMRMLIDARHPEETRVAVVKGNRIEEFDFESAEHKQLKGNIYLAKVTRVEPSLQAAFVDYGGHRHGFLAFSEIHPDYYQIPVADPQAPIDEEEPAQRGAHAEAGRPAHRGGGGPARRPPAPQKAAATTITTRATTTTTKASTTAAAKPTGKTAAAKPPEMAAMARRRRSSSRSAAPTRWKKCPTACRACGVSTRSRK